MDDHEWSMRLDDQLCFALYAASRAVTALYRPVLVVLGLTYPQYLVMLVLWERGSVSVKELGAALQLDYGTLTPLLKRLEAHGLLCRQRRAEDERSVLITLTDQGTALYERAETVPEFIRAAYGLDQAEFEQLRGSLRSLTTNVTRAAGGAKLPAALAVTPTVEHDAPMREPRYRGPEITLTTTDGTVKG